MTAIIYSVYSFIWDPSYSRVWNRRSPLNKHSPPLKNFHIRILIHFYINQGIAIIFQFFFAFKIFQKRISVALCLFRSLEYISSDQFYYVFLLFYEFEDQDNHRIQKYELSNQALPSNNYRNVDFSRKINN